MELVQTQPGAKSEVALKTEWTTLKEASVEHAKWINRHLLRSLIGDKPFNAWVIDEAGKPRDALVRAIMHHPDPYVGVLNGNHELVKLIDRQSLVEMLAGSQIG